MSEQPLIFDLGKRPPTTRALALQIREGGETALDEAQRRADAARYQEVTCKSALNSVKGMPFNWTLNPYRGCTHGCHYCFARRYQTQFELGPGDQFSSIIFVKVNLVDVLRRELDKPKWIREQVAVGTATDPYQPIEGHYKLTRRSLEALLAGRTPIGLVTKGPMVVRDADLLADIGRRYGCTVYMSVPTVDDEAWRALEPGTAPPLQRLRAVRQLRDAGVTTMLVMRGTPQILALTSRVNAGEVLGPRMYSVGPYVNEPFVTTADQVDSAVTAERRAGYDCRRNAREAETMASGAAFDAEVSGLPAALRSTRAEP